MDQDVFKIINMQDKAIDEARDKVNALEAKVDNLKRLFIGVILAFIILCSTQFLQS